jgi:hypothetical protein
MISPSGNLPTVKASAARPCIYGRHDPFTRKQCDLIDVYTDQKERTEDVANF